MNISDRLCFFKLLSFDKLKFVLQLVQLFPRHLRVIERFGRFPNRNEALGRESTPEELEFLAGPDAPF